MTKIVDVEGIGETYAKKLIDTGVSTVEALLETGASPKGRKTLSEKAGITETLILKWVNRADLARINGVGSEYTDLLEASGVDTVVELGKRVPTNLVKKMQEINEAKKLVRKMPTESQVSDWVEQAKRLDRKVTY